MTQDWTFVYPYSPPPPSHHDGVLGGYPRDDRARSPGDGGEVFQTESHAHADLQTRTRPKTF